MSLRTGEYWVAVQQRANKWVPACGGTETPFEHNRTKWLYVYNPATEEHMYLNLETDTLHKDYRAENESPFVKYL